MNDSNMTGTGFPNAVPQASSNRETGKKTTRSAIGAKAQTILDFLRQCTPYEADSIRVMVGHATGKGAVNRFLNHGLTKENATGNEAVMRHRQERAQKLMEAVKEFVNIGQLCRVSIALMKISSDFKAVEDARQHLQSQPSNTAGRN